MGVPCSPLQGLTVFDCKNNRHRNITMTISLKQWSCMLWRTNEIRGFLQLRTNWLPWGGGLTIITHGQSGLYICTGGKGGWV